MDGREGRAKWNSERWKWKSCDKLTHFSIPFMHFRIEENYEKRKLCLVGFSLALLFVSLRNTHNYRATYYTHIIFKMLPVAWNYFLQIHFHDFTSLSGCVCVCVLPALFLFFFFYKVCYSDRKMLKRAWIEVFFSRWAVLIEHGAPSFSGVSIRRFIFHRVDSEN